MQYEFRNCISMNKQGIADLTRIYREQIKQNKNFIQTFKKLRDAQRKSSCMAF